MEEETIKDVYDLHVHSTYSDGSASPYRIVKYVKNKNLTALGITDHCSFHSWGRKLLASEILTERKRMIEKFNGKTEIPLLNCIEADILPQGKLTLPGSLDKDFFAYVIASFHTSMSSKKWIEALKNVIQDGKVDILGHPVAYNNVSSDNMEDVVITLSRKDIAVEINERYRFPPDYFIKLLKEHHVQVTLVSDAHSLYEIGEVEESLRLVNEKNLELLDPLSNINSL